MRDNVAVQMELFDWQSEPSGAPPAGEALYLQPEPVPDHNLVSTSAPKARVRAGGEPGACCISDFKNLSAPRSNCPGCHRRTEQVHGHV